MGARRLPWMLALAGISCATGSEVELPRERHLMPPSPSSSAAPAPSQPPSAPEAGPSLGVCDPVTLLEKHSLAGCVFVMTAVAVDWRDTKDRLPTGCHAIAVSNPSDVAVRLRLRFKGAEDTVGREEDAAPYTRRAVVSGREVHYEPLEDGMLAPRASAIVSALWVPGGLGACPARAFVGSTEPVALEWRVTPAIELRSNAPISAVQLSGYGADSVPISFPLVPVHLWETTPTETGLFQPGLPATLVEKWVDDEGRTHTSPWTSSPGRSVALAAFDDTHVTLPHPDGMIGEGILQRGEVFSHTTSDALTGRLAFADKPVALLTTMPGVPIPWTYDGRFVNDGASLASMALPSTAWGSEYVAVRPRERWEGRREQAVWRVVGGADDTRLTYEPSRPEGAPEVVARGELAVFFAEGSFVARSQDDAHPFYFSQSMTGSRYQRASMGDLEPGSERGGAVTVHQLDPSHYARRFAFYALPGMPEQSLVLVRPRELTGEVRLDCAGVLTGWEPLGKRFEILRVPLTGHLFEPVVYPEGVCEAGAHWLEGDRPFWGMLWGWGNDDTQEQLGTWTRGAYALPLFGGEL